MQVGVIGINHKQADVRIREILAQACQKRFSLESPLDSFVLLATCNRCEIYFSGVDLAEAHQLILSTLREEIAEEFEQKCYSFFGQDCFFHLVKVTTGLDSAATHETEIQGQVKSAYEASIKLRVLSAPLHFLFQKSLKIAKDVRSSCIVPKTMCTIEHAILHVAQEFFTVALPKILFIGSSKINAKIARFLKKKGALSMTFCNRTRSKATLLSEELGGDVLDWSDLLEHWSDFDFVISGVTSPTAILKSKSPYLPKDKLLIDLAVPRNIAPDIGCTLLNIDDLNTLLEKRKVALQTSIKDSEAVIEQLIEKQIIRFKEKTTLYKLLSA